MNRTFAGGNALKALDFTRSGVSDAFSVLFDNLIHRLAARCADTEMKAVLDWGQSAF
jgi:hypothetical protein